MPLGQSSRRALSDYIRKHRPIAPLSGTDPVFPTIQGYPLKPDYVYKIVSGACREAGITGKRLGAAYCRHTFARKFLLNGGDLINVAAHPGTLEPGGGQTVCASGHQRPAFPTAEVQPDRHADDGAGGEVGRLMSLKRAKSTIWSPILRYAKLV